MALSTIQFTTPLIALILSFLAIRIILIPNISKHALDVPNKRSSHEVAVPRIGGVAIVLAISISWLILGLESAWLLLGLSGIIAVISFVDDLRHVNILIRLSIHFVVATAFVYFQFGDAELSWGFRIICVIAIAWMINLYNFMDGIDGLAGGMAFFGFAAYGLATVMFSTDLTFAFANFCISGAALAFLYFNFFPAKIFLGDVGSTNLGFLAAVLGLYGWYSGIWPIYFPVLVFLPFIADASITISKRLLSNKKIWQPHREHYYQRLLTAGHSHKQATLIEYGFMIASSAVALFMLGQEVKMQFIILITTILCSCAFLFFIDNRWKNDAVTSPEAIPGNQIIHQKPQAK